MAAISIAVTLFAVSCGLETATSGSDTGSDTITANAAAPTVAADPNSTTAPATDPATESTIGIGPPDTPAPSTTNMEKAPDPVGVRIPTIAVDAEIGPLGLRSDGTIDVPSDFAKTGWWVDGPEPGDLGPAVILGHVDSRSGPAVFYDIRSMAAGDSILVDRADGSVATFVVDRIEQHPKNDFPTEAVYGPTPDAELRLVTCGGEFDRSLRSYKDNIIVFARLIGIAPSA